MPSWLSQLTLVALRAYSNDGGNGDDDDGDDDDDDDDDVVRRLHSLVTLRIMARHEEWSRGRHKDIKMTAAKRPPATVRSQC